MRIISWNCNMSLGRKWHLLATLEPDLLILQEVSKRDIDAIPAGFKHWVGSNQHKGLAVVGFGDHEFRVHDLYTDELPWLIPLQIADLDINLLAVWAHVKTSTFRYVRILHAALEHYRDFIAAAPTVIAGDFNSNTIWDKKHAENSHTPLVAKLHALGLKSLYHEIANEEQGKELIPTWYMYRHRDKRYHLDYAFLANSLMANARLVIGAPDLWLPFSDHMPLIVDIGSIYAGTSRRISSEPR